jgi:hypothetical protein
MATGTSSPASSPAFHADDPEQETGYSTLSVPAIISLVLGLASPLCFGAPLLILIPIAGMAISVFALRRIATSGGALAGNWAAVTGLVLSTAMAVAPATRESVIRVMRTQQSETFATDWLNLMISGHTDAAFRLTADALRGAPPSDPSQKVKPADPYDTFRALPLVKAISAAGADATIHFVSTVGYDMQSFQRVFVRQRFEITPAATKSDAQPVDVTLTTQRTRLAKEGRSRWLIWSLDDGSKPTSIPTTSP